MLFQGLFRPVESVYVSMFGDHPVPLGLGPDHVQYARLLPEGIEPEKQKFGYFEKWFGLGQSLFFIFHDMLLRGTFACYRKFG